MNTSGGASPDIGLRTAPLTPSESRMASVILDRLAALIGRNPAEARSRAEHLEALNLEFDTWLDER